MMCKYNQKFIFFDNIKQASNKHQTNVMQFSSSVILNIGWCKPLLWDFFKLFVQLFFHFSINVTKDRHTDNQKAIKTFFFASCLLFYYFWVFKCTDSSLVIVIVWWLPRVWDLWHLHCSSSQDWDMINLSLFLYKIIGMVSIHTTRVKWRSENQTCNWLLVSTFLVPFYSLVLKHSLKICQISITIKCVACPSLLFALFLTRLLIYYQDIY